MSALALPALAFVVVFSLLPLGIFVWDSFVVDGAWTVRYYRELWHTSYFANVLSRTVIVSLAVTFGAVALGYPVALQLRRSTGSGKLLLVSLVLLPYLTSVLVRVFAWAGLLALHGPVNKVLVAIGIFDEPKLLGHSTFGSLMGLIHVLTPIAVLAMWARMEKIDDVDQVVASALGASPSRSFMTIYWPQSLHGVVAAGSLVYVLALGAYVIPATLGGTSGLLFAQVVAAQATTALNWPLSGAMTAAMLATAAVPALFVAVVGILRRPFSRKNVYSRKSQVATRFVYPVLDRAPVVVWRWGHRLSALAVLAFLVLPEIIVIIYSFGPIHELTLPPKEFTLAGYHAFFADQSWTHPLLRSLVYASVDAAIALVLGALAAYAFARKRGRLTSVGMALLLLPLALPEIVPAISYYVFANKVGIAGTATGVILGQAVTAVGLVVVVVFTVIRNIDVNLEYASQMCGASKLRTLGRIVLPLAVPGLVVGTAYGFLNAFDNLVLPLFIVGTDPTIPVRMFASLQDSLTSLVAVVASILIAVLLAATGIALAFMARTKARLTFPTEGDR